MSVALVCVVCGEAYERYARGLFDSAFEFFGPDPVVAHIALPGREEWPDATMYRYHAILESERVFYGLDHVFLCDADMRFEGLVGPEILGSLVATFHPGYVQRPRAELPYETDPRSAAFVNPERGGRYYCGGFVGGKTVTFMGLARRIVNAIDLDDENSIVAKWHDESHLNATLADQAPSVTLSPSYCYPDDDRAYLGSWPERYERKLVALDKTPAERCGR